MFKTKIAALAIAAVSVVSIGAGMAGTANAATIATTNFTFPAGTTTSATLSVDANNPVPANGTPVTFDLQQFVTNASATLNNGVADTGVPLADDVEAAVVGLENVGNGYTVYAYNQALNVVDSTDTKVGGASIPTGDFANLPLANNPPTTVISNFQGLNNNYVLPSEHTTITLYVVSSNSTTDTFEVSPVLGGDPLTFTYVAAIDPSLGSDVTWSEPSGTTVTTVPPTVHVHHTGTPTHTVNPNAPQLSHGQAVSVAPTRENVTFDLSSPSWVHFRIVGPGAINGHQGWVNGVAGTNTAYYEGLNSNSGYTVLYQPVTGQGSLTPVAGSHEGYVWFVTS